MCSQERWISTSYAFSENLSEYMNIYLIRMKYETFEKFKDFQDEVQNHCNKEYKQFMIKIIKEDI